MATAAVTTHLLLLPNCSSSSSSSIRCLQTSNPSSLTLARAPIKPNLSSIRCSPLSASIVEENAVPPSSKGASIQAKAPIEDAENLPQRGCKACGREEVERGCNGEGRVQGGIATVPGFGWWPIKAFRPCPGFVASGGRYRRRGQSMDEVAWGTSERKASVSSTDEVR